MLSPGRIGEITTDLKTLIAEMAFLSCFLIVIPVGMADDLEGKVVSVLDGDTIEVIHEKKPERIRLYGIDCPEKGQPFGQKAKQFTSALLFGKDVKIETHGRDKHRGRWERYFRARRTLIKHSWGRAGAGGLASSSRKMPCSSS